MKAICIDNSGMETYLTKDKEYEIEEYIPDFAGCTDEFYRVCNIDSEVDEQSNGFYKDRFKLL